MARQGDRARPPKQSRDLGRSIASGAIIGCVTAGVIVFGIVAFVGIIVAIKFREAHRHGGGPFAKPPQIVIDPPDDPRPKPPVIVGPGGSTRTAIVGGANDPLFEDVAPQGGVLIGLELAVVNNNSIRAVRPIYLVNGKEQKGALVGAEKLNTVVKARQGFAVSALNVNAGLWIDGMSVTFARSSNGKLDLKDTYPSDYFGGKGGERSVLGGNGMTVVGVTGRRNDENAATGIGLLLK